MGISFANTTWLFKIGMENLSKHKFFQILQCALLSAILMDEKLSNYTIEKQV